MQGLEQGLEPDLRRYLLYGAITCPFTHRVLLARACRDLERELAIALARPVPGLSGWAFDPPDSPHADPLFGAGSLREICETIEPAFNGKASVPMLVEKPQPGTVGGRVVSQDSRAIALALNAHPGGRGPDLYPATAAGRIDRDIESFDQDFVRAIIVAGSTASQADYEVAVASAFGWLAALDKRLRAQRYLGGAAPDLSDLVVFTGLVRFDSCYYFGSRCHLRRIQDYPVLWAYTRDLYQLPGVAATVDLRAFVASFFMTRTPSRDGVVPAVPLVDFTTLHGRQQLSVP